MRTVVDAWALFNQNVISPVAPAVQRNEMRRAFYAGSWAMLQLITEITSIEDLSEAAGEALIAGLHDELRRFVAEVEGGRA